MALGRADTAAYWFEEAAKREPDEFRANVGLALLYRFRDEEERGVAIARRLQTMVPGNNMSLVTLVSFGRYEEAIEYAATDWPSLSCENEPQVQRNNIFQATNLSLAYEMTGKGECSDALLAGILELMKSQPGLGPRAFGFLEVEVYARRACVSSGSARSKSARTRQGCEIRLDSGKYVKSWSPTSLGNGLYFAKWRQTGNSRRFLIEPLPETMSPRL